jgi:hypothetical protein
MKGGKFGAIDCPVDSVMLGGHRNFLALWAELFASA